MPGYMFAAGVVSAAAGHTTSTGQVAWTVARAAGQSIGVYTITFATAHPLGANYIVNITAVGTMVFLPGSPLHRHQHQFKLFHLSLELQNCRMRLSVLWFLHLKYFYYLHIIH